MKVAIVHYWLVGMRGGERVLEALCALYPEAVLITHVADRAALSSAFRATRSARPSSPGCRARGSITRNTCP